MLPWWKEQIHEIEMYYLKTKKKNWIANSDLAELEKLIDVGSLLEKHEEHNW